MSIALKDIEQAVWERNTAHILPGLCKSRKQNFLNQQKHKMKIPDLSLWRKVRDGEWEYEYEKNIYLTCELEFSVYFIALHCEGVYISAGDGGTFEDAREEVLNKFDEQLEFYAKVCNLGEADND